MNFTSPEYADHFAALLRPLPDDQATPHRDYQRSAIDAVLPKLRKNGNPQLIHVATGGGKTRIANEVVVTLLKRRGGQVVWLAKDWELSRQAAVDLSRRHGPALHLTRLGGDGSQLHPLPEGLHGDVIYSTLTTFFTRVKGCRLNRFYDPTLVVWDECHWGELANSGQRLQKWCLDREVPLLGLTATPRAQEVSGFQVAFSMSFQQLVAAGYLAVPVQIDPVPTGVAWYPSMDYKFGDFTGPSLETLGRSINRNRSIIEHFRRRKRTYSQSLVFACNIRHADLLARKFNEAGVRARSLHSQWYSHDNAETLRLFREGELQVLVNVAKLTHGVDLPSIRTVFLCRPTLSDMLFSQMVGRGARLDPATGKSAFHLVEFTDNLERFGDQLVTAKTFFSGTG